MNSYNKLIHILVLITDLYLYGGTRRYYKVYTYTEVPIGATELNDVPYFTLFVIQTLII